jgi:hypothetical protein
MNKFLVIFLLLFCSISQAKQIRISVIDSGYSNNLPDLKVCKNGLKDLTNKGMPDKLGHGTLILGIIAKALKDIDYCVYVIKIYDESSSDTLFITHLMAYVYSYVLNPDIINYSSSGPIYVDMEEFLIKGLISKNIKFVAAAGNENMDLDKECSAWPACIKGVISVGNKLNNGLRASRSNYGKRVTQWEVGERICINGMCGSGTSMSAAMYTSKLAKELSRNK